MSYKDIKILIANLKLVYKAITEESALLNLELFNEKWGKKYLKIKTTGLDYQHILNILKK